MLAKRYELGVAPLGRGVTVARTSAVWFHDSAIVFRCTISRRNARSRGLGSNVITLLIPMVKPARRLGPGARRRRSIDLPMIRTYLVIGLVIARVLSRTAHQGPTVSCAMSQR